VSDGATVLADVATAGDEPLMLARALPGVVVLVGANRFLSGQYGERELGVTVHVLDDGFQHVALARDIDLVVVDESDLNDHVLPAGSLREPLRNAAVADAVLVPADESEPVARVARALGVSKAFRVSRSVHTPRPLGDHPAAHVGGARVLAFAGIARPDRFFADLAASGRAPVDTLTFSDHHPYSQRDIDQIADRAKKAGASELLTTEKDAVRLEGLNLGALRIAVIPLTATIEPADQFARWCFDRLAAVRPAPSTSHSAPGTSHSAPRTPHQQ
jgi:tetraacyldisaccharide 4'-kinase